jgi:hypothetical protein
MIENKDSISYRCKFFTFCAFSACQLLVALAKRCGRRAELSSPESAGIRKTPLRQEVHRGV